MPKKKSVSLIPVQRIEKSILLIREQRVILDEDLAALYGVPTKRLNEQMKRNRERFPADFVFQLSKEEFVNLKSHFATASWGGRRSPPYAFTEHGALMAANVLKSQRAIETSILVVRTFTRLREMLASHKDLARKLAALERNYDAQFKIVFDAVRKLMEPPPEPKKKRRIGFRTGVEDDK